MQMKPVTQISDSNGYGIGMYVQMDRTDRRLTAACCAAEAVTPSQMSWLRLTSIYKRHMLQ